MVGAPPDILGPLGQNWGLSPMDPHVMALLRLWWTPVGETADRGAYVTYPVDDLLALESQRCMVIGEDLGTVPTEIIGKLRDTGVYSYRVLHFERDGEDNFRAPQADPMQAMATVATHDLPTLRG